MRVSVMNVFMDDEMLKIRPKGNGQMDKVLTGFCNAHLKTKLWDPKQTVNFNKPNF